MLNVSRRRLRQALNELQHNGVTCISQAIAPEHEFKLLRVLDSLPYGEAGEDGTQAWDHCELDVAATESGTSAPLAILGQELLRRLKFSAPDLCQPAVRQGARQAILVERDTAGSTGASPVNPATQESGLVATFSLGAPAQFFMNDQEGAGLRGYFLLQSGDLVLRQTPEPPGYRGESPPYRFLKPLHGVRYSITMNIPQAANPSRKDARLATLPVAR